MCMYPCVCIYIHTYIKGREIYYTELAHIIMEANKSQDLQGESVSCKLMT